MKLSRRGAAGLIIAIIVLSYMMMVSTSQFRLLELERSGHISRNMSKKAFFCAFAGVQFALERVRKDRSLLNWSKRPYFCFDLADFSAKFGSLGFISTFAESSAIANAANKYADDIYEINPTYTTTYLSTDEVGVGIIKFRLATYPQNTANKNEYWVKCQGYYDDPISTRTYTSQVIALIMLDPATNMFKLKKYIQTDVQKMSVPPAATDAFYDFEYIL